MAPRAPAVRARAVYFHASIFGTKKRGYGRERFARAFRFPARAPVPRCTKTARDAVRPTLLSLQSVCAVQPNLKKKRTFFKGRVSSLSRIVSRALLLSLEPTTSRPARAFEARSEYVVADRTDRCSDSSWRQFGRCSTTCAKSNGILSLLQEGRARRRGRRCVSVTRRRPLFRTRPPRRRRKTFPRFFISESDGTQKRRNRRKKQKFLRPIWTVLAVVSHPSLRAARSACRAISVSYSPTN